MQADIHTGVRPENFGGKRVAVGGAGISGVAAVNALLAAGADVSVIDRKDSDALAALAERGVRVSVGDAVEFASDTTALVVSPGWRPENPVIGRALAAGIEVYSEPELAWRLRDDSAGTAAPWLAVTGTNGKTTAVTMLASMLEAAGLSTRACGNIGHPVISSALGGDGRRYDVLAVELSSFQLHWSSRLAPSAGAILNLADDHLDWHGGFDAYAAAKLAIWRGPGVAIGNADDAGVAERLGEHSAPVRPVAFTLSEPSAGQLGVIDGVLVDRAFSTAGVELASVVDVVPPGDHNVANALAAAALARAHGVPPDAVSRGLSGYTPQPHRNRTVAIHGGVRFVDDSKATNPHAAAASLTSYSRIVWIAGGQLKGVNVDDTVRAVADRLAGVVLLGVDRAEIAASLARHAPQLPVVDIERSDADAMADVVAAAVKLAQPGDVVLLAPAAASLDMFASYGARGNAFAAAVAELA
ncbi:MAG TPA: UDP-N-acetylmuramoyl-L-alanine--D-glutamate ligase [Mycobacteriales bacterium]|jgi:UDP-N-acetylmuramoylalanine--D-glutamate ligase|nr:UDP-N-acetylmuramoyl-L-alanine--D-glutamate ligase [Mycobacteriales bacterium]